MKKATVSTIALLVVLILLFVGLKWWEPTPAGTKHVPQSAAGPAPAVVHLSNAPAPSAPNPWATPEEGRSATEKVARMVTAFHTRMGENPVGTNAEITKALLGGNPVHATFSDETPRLNAKGELIDPWGTPYFFHQISGDDMEIHSAGPDKIMGTPDDIVVQFVTRSGQ